MTPEQLEQLESLFDAACRLPESQRIPFARQVCEKDTTLCRNLLALLEADQKTATPLDQPVLTPDRLAAALPPEPLIPPVIGKYRLIRPLGEGGMGIVYEAEQQNPRRRVAVKLLRPASANKDAVRRFSREAELLARLHHPGIAQIFEAGIAQVELRNRSVAPLIASDAGAEGVAHETSLPFLVMELIEGQTLLRHCDSHGLSQRERVALMVKVCDAVQHAHQRGIIHRDLKPANILVVSASPPGGVPPRESSTAAARSHALTVRDEISSQPKILDFGVARVLEIDPMRTARTLTGQIVGTLPYMSPEQFSGDPGEIDTRSDVYALGVILYELLCGRLPHASQQPIELARKIREDDPPRPSSIRPAVRGDLETIILKTLQKEPSRRYQTAAELRDDLSRFLENEPIEARRTSGLYVLRKTLVRYRFAASMLAGFVLLTTVSSIALGVLYQRSERQKREADARAEALRRGNYLNTVALAHANLREGNSGHARVLLANCPPDLRDWEWRYLNTQCDTSVRVIQAHEGTTTLQFAPDGSRLLSLGYDRAIRVWSLSSERPLQEFGTGSMAETAAFSPDGRRVAVATRYPYVQVFSLDGSARPQQLAAHPGRVWANRVAWSRRGDLIASCAMGNTILLFDGQTLEQIGTIRSRQNLSAIAFHPGDDVVALGAQNGHVEIWTLREPEKIMDWKVHTDYVSALQYTSDGRRLVTRGTDNMIRVWDPRDGSVICSISCSASSAAVVISPDDRRIAAGVDTMLREWDIETGAPVSSRLGHPTMITDVAYSADGAWIASADRDGQMRLWNARQAASPRVIEQPGRIVMSTALDASAGVLWIASSDGRLVGKTFPAGDELFVHRARGGDVLRAALAPHGLFGIVVGQNGEVHALDAQTGAPLAHLMTSPSRARAVAFSDDSRWAAVTRENGEITVFDLAHMRLHRAFMAFEELAYSVAFLPDGRTLAACGGDGSVSLWDAIDGRMLRRLGAHDDRAFVLCLSPDGRTIATGGNDRTIRLWSVEGDRPERILRGHSGSVRALRFSRSGRRLFSGGAGETMYVWDVESGSQILTLSAHARAVESITASADGRYVVTGGADGYVKVWDSRFTPEMPADR